MEIKYYPTVLSLMCLFMELLAQCCIFCDLFCIVIIIEPVIYYNRTHSLLHRYCDFAKEYFNCFK